VRCIRLLPLLLLAACGGGSSKPAPPSDETLQRETTAGQQAYQMERPDQAIASYQAALTRAQARDDLKAIGDIGFNLAVAELDANDPSRALATARATEQELRRRGATPFPALLLVEATALYRSGSPAEADSLAAQVQAAGDHDTAARATFLRGVIADERGDEARLNAAARGLDKAGAPALQADAAELAARAALRRGDFEAARRSAERTVALRQQTLDYRGLARALALAGKAAARAGDAAAAADFYLRAGRSAAAQGDKPAAGAWLSQAVALAPDPTLRRTAGDLLKGLNSSSD
jgi:hypothetical protein